MPSYRFEAVNDGRSRLLLGDPLPLPTLANLRHAVLRDTEVCDGSSLSNSGRELGTDELVDRNEEVAAFVQAIRQGSNLLLVGSRRFGKTSILNTLEDRLSNTDAVVLRFDPESCPALDNFVTSLISTVAKALKPSAWPCYQQRMPKSWKGLPVTVWK
jgi:hypothetical protein